MCRSNLEIAIKCGGHRFSSASSVEGGVVIDMKALNSVEVDTENMRVTIGGGCLWGDVYTALREHDLECVGGGVHVVGVGGHLTGGENPEAINCSLSNLDLSRWLWTVVAKVWHGYVHPSVKLRRGEEVLTD
jgi:hypothetical protein